MPYDIFISYKNDNSGNIFAERLANDLKQMGYSVYFNSHERRSGAFDERIRSAISGCRDFIAIVSEGYLTDLLNPRVGHNSWIRNELMEARCNSKSIRITPIYLTGVIKPHLGDFRDGDEASFFAELDGVVMPGDAYDVSPLQSLTERLVSHADGMDAYRNLANGNPAFNANDRLRAMLAKASDGDYEAMYLAGLMLYYSFGIDRSGRAVRDLASAHYWFKRVADEAPEEMGLIKSCSRNLISKMYYQGDPVPQSYEECLRYLMQAKDDPSAMMSAAYMRGIGLGCEWSYEDAEEFYNSAAVVGGFSLEDLASFYEARGRFPEAERTYLRIGKDNLSAFGNYKLGMIYRNGSHANPPAPDFERASIHLQRSREEGHVIATFELGNLYFRPTGSFPKDFVKAQECFREAADAGYMQAQYLLAYMLEYGHVEKNVPEAIHYYELAAAQGHILASESLARLYQTSDHLNYQLAFRHCEYAAKHGDSQAEFMLGVLYLLGRGCDYSVTLAKHWFESAKGHGFMQAAKMLELVGELDVSAGMPSWL